MNALKFSEFYEGNFEDIGYELYFVKDTDNKAMYIGISLNSIWHRWFGEGASHMDTNASGNLFGTSVIGQVIERRFPNSWDWMIELWTKEDCLTELGNILTNGASFIVRTRRCSSCKDQHQDEGSETNFGAH